MSSEPAPPQAASRPDVPRLAGREIEDLVRLALREDLGVRRDPAFDGAWGAAEVEALLERDLATARSIAASTRAVGVLTAKGRGVLAGLDLFAATFRALDPTAETVFEKTDGDRVLRGDLVARTVCSARALLSGERTALNLLQRASGIATLTRRFVDAAAKGVKAGRTAPGVFDTRKTAPGLRVLDKHAVVAGGGSNHRYGLFDEAMLKDNHLDLSGVDASDESARAEFVARVRRGLGPDVRLHVEARSESEARGALRGGADVVLLDNFAAADLALVVRHLRAFANELERPPGALPIEFEASGGIDMETIAEFAGTGVDRISVGALTHSVRALDLSLGIELEPQTTEPRTQDDA
jgi:nicotinate-nucleotide pyrophosphorylase (carboxylating)